jgi:hypothetical protein
MENDVLPRNSASTTEMNQCLPSAATGEFFNKIDPKQLFASGGVTLALTLHFLRRKHGNARRREQACIANKYAVRLRVDGQRMSTIV